MMRPSPRTRRGKRRRTEEGEEAEGVVDLEDEVAVVDVDEVVEEVSRGYRRGNRRTKTRRRGSLSVRFAPLHGFAWPWIQEPYSAGYVAWGREKPCTAWVHWRLWIKIRQSMFHEHTSSTWRGYLF
jgi:hypothetical protein